MPIQKRYAVPLLLMLGSASANAESGLASFYPGVGKKSEMTCAHRSHPFGKMLRVSYGKVSVECRVNDRGPFKRGRIIDVSTSAALALGMINAGVVHVLVEAITEVKELAEVNELTKVKEVTAKEVTEATEVIVQ